MSSSPSNTPPPLDRAAFPRRDAVRQCRVPASARHRTLGIDQRIRLVVGFSMGAQQAFHWGALYPKWCSAIAPMCGIGRTSPHNYLFLEGVKAALMADSAFAGGWYGTPPVEGLLAFSRVYAGWAFRRISFANRNIARWAGFARRHRPVLRGLFPAARCERSAGDAVELAARRHQRQSAIQRRPAKALRAITARAIVMPHEPISISASGTTKWKWRRCRMRSCGRFRRSGDMRRAAGQTLFDNSFIDAALRELLA